MVAMTSDGVAAPDLYNSRRDPRSSLISRCILDTSRRSEAPAVAPRRTVSSHKTGISLMAISPLSNYPGANEWAGTTRRGEARSKHPSRSGAGIRQAKSSRDDPCVKSEPTLGPVWQRALRGANKKILWSASAIHGWRAFVRAGRGIPSAVDLVVLAARPWYILIAEHEETCLVSAYLVGGICADASTCRVDRQSTPGPGRAGVAGCHRPDAVGARRQRRLGPGLSLRGRFRHAGNDLGGQSTRRPHGADRRLHLMDAAEQDAHRGHAFLSVLRRGETAGRPRRRHRLQSRFVCQSGRAARQGQREADEDRKSTRLNSSH